MEAAAVMAIALANGGVNRIYYYHFYRRSLGELNFRDSK
jgi:hypothetical protein